MSKISTNPCIICGKERVIVKTSKEKIGNSTVLTTITGCPDPECQKKVDVVLAKEKAHRDDIQSEFKKREKLRMKKVLLSRLHKAKSGKPSNFLV